MLSANLKLRGIDQIKAISIWLLWFLVWTFILNFAVQRKCLSEWLVAFDHYITSNNSSHHWLLFLVVHFLVARSYLRSPLIFVSQFVHSCALLSHYYILLQIVFFSKMLSCCSSDSVPRMKFQGYQISVSELQDFCRIWRLCYQKSFPNLPMMQFSIV